MDYIFYEIFDAMVSYTCLPYAPYIQLLINDTAVAEDLSQYARMEHRPKKTYVKMKQAALAAGSFLGDARTSGTTHRRQTSSHFIQKEVKKLNWFQRNVLCINVGIQHTQDAEREDHIRNT
jgi:hypothetical protein